ncbi:MAG TPA: TetR/AcrR family transcriptional regulator [Oculatellaceae cyanobacterium]
MARPRSGDKRNTLLAAAAKVFASNGLSATTASVTAEAGVAEGTLFLYFKGKKELINVLYAEIKRSLAEAMLEGYSKSASIHDRTKHVWYQYVDWGVQNPDQLASLHKIKVWDELDEEVREAANAQFCELHLLTKQAIEQGTFANINEEFVVAMLTAQAETTMQFMRQDASNAAFYKKRGFEIFWNGLSHSE